MENVGHQWNIRNTESTFVAAFLQNALEQFYFIMIKRLSDALYHPNVSEKLCPKVSIARNGLFNDIQMSIYQ